MCRSAVAAAADICAICQEVMGNTALTMTMPCGHKVHKPCNKANCQHSQAGSWTFFMNKNGKLSPKKFKGNKRCTVSYIMRCPLCRCPCEICPLLDRNTSYRFLQLFYGLCNNYRFHPSYSDLLELRMIYNALEREIGPEAAVELTVKHIVLDRMSDSLGRPNPIEILDSSSSHADDDARPTSAAP